MELAGLLYRGDIDDGFAICGDYWRYLVFQNSEIVEGVASTACYQPQHGYENDSCSAHGVSRLYLQCNDCRSNGMAHVCNLGSELLQR